MKKLFILFVAFFSSSVFAWPSTPGGWPGALGGVSVIESFTPVSAVTVATTFTTPTIANNAGNTQLVSTGVHGLTSAVAVGKNVYITWSGGTGITGLYQVISVDSTLAFTVGLPYSGALGTPTVTLANSSVPLGNVTIPGGGMGANGSLDILPIYTYTPAATETGTTEFRVNGSYLDTNGIGGTNALAKRFLIANRGSASINMYIFDSGFVASGKTFNTTLPMTITFGGYSATANGVVTLEGYRVLVTYQ